MTLIRQLWRFIDRLVERAIAPEFIARDIHRGPENNLPTPHPAGFIFVPPPRRWDQKQP